MPTAEVGEAQLSSVLIAQGEIRRRVSRLNHRANLMHGGARNYLAMIRVGRYTFRDVVYDGPSDVLYATVLDEPTARRVKTPEEHVCTFDSRERLTGIAFMGAGEQLRRDGAVYVTLPSGERERVQGAEAALRA